MNICFVANFHKTFFFEKIASKLKKKGYNVYWICFDNSIYSHLLIEYSSDNILKLSRDFIKNEPIYDFKLNELVYGDRFLKHDPKFGYDFLSSIQSPLYSFIDKNDLNFIFGEITHAHEILISRITLIFKELKSVYLHPQSVRIPDKRFFFLENEFQNKVYKDKVINSNWREEYNLIKAKKPRRVKQVDKDVKRELSFKGKFKRLLRFFSQENIISDSPSQIKNRFKRSKLAIIEEFNKLSYNFIRRENIDYVKDKKFVLYTLHMQPEASVDVVGVYYDNQLINIYNIFRVIPSDWYIVIKEHSNAIGNRNYKFFRDFKKLHNSCIINEYTDSHELIKLSQAVFSVSGTIAYEAALMNKKAFVFSDIFFTKLKNCTRVTLEKFREIDNINDLFIFSEEMNNQKMTIEEFSEFIYKISLNGIVDAPLNSSDWNDEDNIDIVADSFHVFLRK